MRPVGLCAEDINLPIVDKASKEMVFGCQTVKSKNCRFECVADRIFQQSVVDSSVVR